ncbi:hypothetical protein quinque_008857 [Culex quinquefasciatus]
MSWLCPGCHLPKTVESYEDEGQDFLPPELWLEIFKLLDGTSILQARMTCHRWREIVDGSRWLQDLFWVIIEGMLFDRWHEPEDLPPAANNHIKTDHVAERSKSAVRRTVPRAPSTNATTTEADASWKMGHGLNQTLADRFKQELTQ